jgi:hypothetical protein
MIDRREWQMVFKEGNRGEFGDSVFFKVGGHLFNTNKVLSKLFSKK